MAIEGDVVLIYRQDQPAVFARVEHIEPDIKKDWYHITLLFLTIPTQIVTWILRGSYIEGEAFTMGGIPMRLELVEKTTISEDSPSPKESDGKKEPKKPGTVIPFKKP
ncbi:MAG: hypothetical protein JRL30_25865 [Deltaproteobacteria bacterium]|nr:hypothetical protein [Deltaproteobacteria bacterium]